MRIGAKYILLFLLWALPFISLAQKQPVKVEEKKEGIVVLKLVLCNPKDEEYCLVSHNIHFKKNTHTLSVGAIEKLADPGEAGSMPLSTEQAKQLLSVYNTHKGFHNVAATGFFTREILATGAGWKRFKSGALYLSKYVGNYDWNTVYVVYKVRGNFALSGQEYSGFYNKLYDEYYQGKHKEPVHYPVAEVLSIEWFKPLSKKELKKLDLKVCTMPYYRLKIAGVEDFLDQAEAGKRDLAR